MTQNSNQSVRNAEAAETISHVPTFEEVYAMPYIQESLRSLLMSNSMNYPSLASYEDDIRQEMLIFLAKSLVKFDPAKSEITTFCRMKLETGLIRARRYYRTDSQRAISQAVPLDKLVNAEKQADSGVSSAIRMKTEFYSESPFEKQAWNDAFQDVVDSLSDDDRVVCEAIMEGCLPREMFAMGICGRSSLYERILPSIKEAFVKKKF